MLLSILCYFMYKIVNKITHNANDAPQAPKTNSNNLYFNIWLNQVDQYLDDTNTTSNTNKIQLVLSKLDNKSRKTVKELMSSKAFKHTEIYRSFYARFTATTRFRTKSTFSIFLIAGRTQSKAYITTTHK